MPNVVDQKNYEHYEGRVDEENIINKPDENLFRISKMCSDTFHQLRKFSTTMLSYSCTIF